LNPDENGAWFDALAARGVKPGLDNIRELLRRLDDPQKGIRTVHVAGTDGKGSVCAMIESILRASDMRTGMFTSPEILRINECIRISGEEVPDNDLENAIAVVRPHVDAMADEGMACTRFEVLTAMALVLFRMLSVDVAIIEVGMGGRLDCTNVVEPEVTVINRVSMEHTAFLGNTIEEIASEKAGIMKPGVPCVTICDGPALETIMAQAERIGSRLTQVSASEAEVVSSKPDSIDMLYRGELITVSLPGRFQAGNAVLAIAAVSLMEGYEDSIAPHVLDGLSSVSWPCRMQKLIAMPIILDVTHTVTGAKCLASDISEIYGEVLLVIGMLGDKDLDGVASTLAPVATKVFVTSPASPRAADALRMAEAVKRHHGDVSVFPDVDSALDEAMEARDDCNILVTGSFRMAEEALEWLQKRFA
jgi:dihydrofolate synthase/folylpolyglutamate synthase